MRTKTLIATAALTAAGIMVSMAQDPVYSVNAVGYVNKTLSAGYDLISNPLNNGENTLNDAITGLADGTTAFIWTGDAFSQHLYLGAAGWVPNAGLAPGEGAFIQSAAEQTVTFVGEVPQGELSNAIPAGLSIKSSIVPQAGDLFADLGLSLGAGDTLFQWNAATQSFGQSLFLPGVGFTPAVQVEVGEAFFVQAGAETSWDRTFSVND